MIASDVRQFFRIAWVLSMAIHPGGAAPLHVGSVSMVAVFHCFNDARFAGRWITNACGSLPEFNSETGSVVDQAMTHRGGDDGINRSRVGVQKSLGVLTAGVAHSVSLSFGFDAFGDG